MELQQKNNITTMQTIQGIRKLIAEHEIIEALKAMEDMGIDVSNLKWENITYSTIEERDEKEDFIISEMIKLLWREKHSTS